MSTNFSYRLGVLSTLVGVGGTIGGWALTQRLAGVHAGRSFLTLGAVVVLCMLLAEVVLYGVARNRLLFRPLLAIAHTSSLIWFMMCLFLPLFWLESTPAYARFLMGAAILSVCGLNYQTAVNRFRREWTANGEAKFYKFYDSETASLDWQHLIASMRLQLSLDLPAVPSRANPVISALLVLSMLVGLNLRHPFPIFSAYAWGIPCAIGVWVLMQVIGLGVAQTLKIRDLETVIGQKIMPKS